MKRMNFKPSAICICVVIFLLINAADAFADNMKWKEFGYAANIQLADVPDYEGHITGMYQRQGLVIFDNDEIAVYTQRGTMDADNSGGIHDGYYELKFEDGSSFIYKINGVEETKPGELPRLRGEGEFVQGTGRFEGIKGTLKYSGRYYTGLDDANKGAAVQEWTADYTLP